MKKQLLLSLLILVFSVVRASAQCSVKLSVHRAVSCPGSCDGILEAKGTGSGYLNYQWSPSVATGSVATSLCADNYTVTMTDGNNCIAVDSIVLNQPDAFTIVDSVINATCGGLCNGKIYNTVKGGTLPYQYLWDSGDTTMNVLSACAGSYCVYVLDASGCLFTECNIFVNEPSSINIGLIASQFTGGSISCNGAADGSINSFVDGGSPPYKLHWSTNDTIPNISNLGPGTYILTVTDSTGCSASDSVLLTEPPPYIITANILDHKGWGVSCNGAADGSICLTVAGETPPYSYNWSPGISSDSCAAGLTGGSYCILILDINGCFVDTCFTLTEPDPIFINPNVFYPTCDSCADGEIDISTSGGTPGYSYSWSPNVSTDSVATGLTGGTYVVCVTDSNGCNACDSVVVGPPLLVRNMDKNLSLTISPNPNTGKFSLLFNATIQNATMKIVNILGQEIYSDAFSVMAGNKKDIDLNVLEGVYFVRVASKDGSWMGKIVKE